MSIDTVDDLHAAEDHAGRLAEALQRVEDSGAHHLGAIPAQMVRQALAAHDAYCRPSCGWTDDGVCDTGDPETCGCPCAHGEEQE